MWKEVCIFALLIVTRWKITAIHPIFMERLFEWALLTIVLLAGLCYSLERYFKYSRRDIDTVLSGGSILNLVPAVRELASYFFPLLSIFLLQAFVFDFNHVVSGSMKPTLQIGDIVLATKYHYGLRIPIVGRPLLKFSSPKRGDIITFRLPTDRSKRIIKRVIGIPKDHIQYDNKYLTINGKRASQNLIGLVQNTENGLSQTVIHSEENLNEKKHSIYNVLDDFPRSLNQHHSAEHSAPFSWVVPEGHYLIMGDHRDNSTDSRNWGYLPENCLIGKAYRIIFSWNQEARLLNPLSWIRWERVSMKVI